nr:MAG TPA: hypothetical protein [Caudoviricetes sp.]
MIGNKDYNLSYIEYKIKELKRLKGINTRIWSI